LKYNKLPKFAAKNAAGTNAHWASPNNVRICPLAKRYMAFMKLVTFLLFLGLPAFSFAWTCPPDYGTPHKDSMEDHYLASSDILFGVVTGGSFDPKREYPTEFTFKIRENFKGDMVGEVVLKTGPDLYFGDIVLGENYIFTLYGDDIVDFCGFNLRLGRNTRTSKRLRDITKYENAEYHEQIKRFFKVVENAK
jgi:hypothetical protein